MIFIQVVPSIALHSGLEVSYAEVEVVYNQAVLYTSVSVLLSITVRFHS